MENKYYIDTAIWRDLHEDRVDNFRPLGEWAFRLFQFIRENKERIIYSELVVKELSVEYDEETVKNIFKIAIEQSFMEKIEIKRNHIQEANQLSKKLNIPFGDCLHAILAKDSGAIMVTRDKHFFELRNIVEIKKPEDLI